jgi:hypothetical protein
MFARSARICLYCFLSFSSCFSTLRGNHSKVAQQAIVTYTRANSNSPLDHAHDRLVDFAAERLVVHLQFSGPLARFI